MKKRSVFIGTALLYLVMVFIGCATVMPAERLEAGANTAKVYFIMPESTVTVTGFGAVTLGTKFFLWDNDKFISNIGSRDYFVSNFEAGIHYFMATAGDNWYIVKADLAAGKSYYIRVLSRPGFRTATAVLELIEPNNPELPGFLEKSREITPQGKAPKSMAEKAVKELELSSSGQQNVDFIPADKGK